MTPPELTAARADTARADAAAMRQLPSHAVALRRQTKKEPTSLAGGSSFSGTALDY